jgi:hypothetical protein
MRAPPISGYGRSVEKNAPQSSPLLMNTKSLLLALFCSSVPLVPASAQSSGGSSGSSGSSSAGPATGSAPAAGSSSSVRSATGTAPSTSPTGINAATPAPGTPDMSPTLPSRPRATPPNTDSTSRSATEPLPPGITAAPVQPGVSPLSGLKSSELPAVSAGTTPLGTTVRADEPSTPSAPLPAPTAKPPLTTTPVVPREAGNAAAVPPGTDAPATARERATRSATTATDALTAPVGRGTTRVVTTPPPSARAEVMPERPANASDQSWVPGHYVLSGEQWKWIDGSWQRPPVAGARWVPAQYNSQTKRWTEGYWATSTR